MAKAGLIGRKLSEDAQKAGYLETARFSYYGLHGESVTIEDTWREGGYVHALARDGHGHTADVLVTMFILNEETHS